MQHKILNLSDTGHENCSQESTSSTSLIIGTDEFIKMNISNRLNNIFSQNILTKQSLDEGMSYLNRNKVDLVVLDIDQIEDSAIDRFYKFIGHLEIPCLMTGSDTNFLNKLRLEMDTSFVSFLPKSILNTMFTETVQLLLARNAPGKKLTKRIIKSLSRT